MFEPSNQSFNQMKKLLFALALIGICVGPVSAQGGHYKGGKGSSHKSGKYKNASTGNHYRKRK
jgi:hypothetical protein